MSNVDNLNEEISSSHVVHHFRFHLKWEKSTRSTPFLHKKIELEEKAYNIYFNFDCILHRFPKWTVFADHQYPCTAQLCHTIRVYLLVRSLRTARIHDNYIRMANITAKCYFQWVRLELHCIVSPLWTEYILGTSTLNRISPVVLVHRRRKWQR